MGKAAILKSGWGLIKNPELWKFLATPKKTMGLAATGGTGVVLWNLSKGKGVDETVMGILGEDRQKAYSEDGALGVIKNVAAGPGSENKSLGEIVTDTTLGEGTYDKSKDTLSTAIDNLKDATAAAVNGMSAVVKGTSNAVQTMASRGGQQYDDAMLYQTGQQNLFGGGIGGIIGNLLSGGGTMNILSLIMSAFLMFGNFGWMGKVGSIMLGSSALKNMKQRNLQSQIPYSVPQQSYGSGPDIRNLSYNQTEDQSEGTVIHRGRTI